MNCESTAKSRLEHSDLVTEVQACLFDDKETNNK